MSRFRKMMLTAAVCAMSASVFVGCSDDEPTTLGALPVNSCRVTNTTVTVTWSIVPNDHCKGYEITLYQGTRENGQELQKQQIDDNKKCSTSFSGLTQNTKYYVKTKAIPGAGFSNADEFYRDFTTAPDVNVSVNNFEFYQVQSYNAEGELVTTDYYRVNLSWPAIPESNCGGYGLNLYQCEQANWVSSLKAISSVTIGKVQGNIATTAQFEKLAPNTVYTVATQARPNNVCDYSVGDVCLIQFTTPAVPAGN